MVEGDDDAAPGPARTWLFSAVFAAVWAVLAGLSAAKHNWVLVGLAAVAFAFMASAALAQRRLGRRG